MKSICVVAMIIAIISCHEETKKEQSVTDIFSYYLKTAFGDSIPKEKHLFILVPETGCKGCREDALHILHDEAIKTGRTGITYIFSPKVHFNDLMTAPYKTLTDSSMLIDKINLPISNITFIKTAHGKVESINAIRSETTDSIRALLKK
ncbi:MAG: hypothetical protein M3R17_03170 [Bacteroidota bacterium]|nr:hypothetical protein [Bacteroidota bacterium]